MHLRHSPQLCTYAINMRDNNLRRQPLLRADSGASTFRSPNPPLVRAGTFKKKTPAAAASLTCISFPATHRLVHSSPHRGPRCARTQHSSGGMDSGATAMSATTRAARARMDRCSGTVSPTKRHANPSRACACSHFRRNVARIRRACSFSGRRADGDPCWSEHRGDAAYRPTSGAGANERS